MPYLVDHIHLLSTYDAGTPITSLSMKGRVLSRNQCLPCTLSPRERVISRPYTFIVELRCKNADHLTVYEGSDYCRVSVSTMHIVSQGAS